MDQCARGDHALDKKDFTTAVTNYTAAIKINPTAVKYYIKRATAYTRLSPPDHASSLKDAEYAVSLAFKRNTKELIMESQMRRAIALFGLDRYGDSQQCLEWTKKKINAGDKENNVVKTLPIWELKLEKKLKDLDDDNERTWIRVKEIPDVEAPGKDKPAETARPDEGSSGGTTIAAAAESSAVTAQASGVQTPANKIRHEWYQTTDKIILTIYCKGLDKVDANVTIQIREKSFFLSIPLHTGADFNFSLDPFQHSIERMKSHYKVMPTKVEFTFTKAIPGQKWTSLEGTGALDTEENEGSSSDPTHEAVKRAALAPKTDNVGPSYPTSSKSGPKNWDKVANDLTKRPKKNGKEPKEGEDGEEEESAYAGLDDDEGDPTMGFFKTLYKGADEDTRRAMMKSYQESNGTALSTNWAEVGKGKVETSPPDGMEAKKWD
ncbi:suppressor of G2 allele of SKP1, partial [Lecanoromycetidae sp. Uapishka_2]